MTDKQRCFTLTRLGLLLILAFIVPDAHAQKRNQMKFIGAGYDFLFKTKGSFGEGNFFANNAFFFVEYERMLGSWISVSANYAWHIPAKKSAIGNDGGYQPKSYPNYRFDRGDFEESGYSLGYQSRIYFSEIADDENRGYFEFSFRHARFSQKMTGVSYERINYSPGTPQTINPVLPDKNYGINRFGIKLGLLQAYDISADLNIGVYFNIPSAARDKEWKSPVGLNTTSVVLTYIIGVPF